MVAFASIGIATTVAQPRAAMANNDQQWGEDETYVDFTFYNGSASFKADVSWIMFALFDPTDLNIYATGSFYPYADIWFMEGYNYTGNVAEAPCTTTQYWNGSRTVCDRHTVYYDLSSGAQYFNTYGKRRSLACHEVGHVFALEHSNKVGTTHPDPFASCMRSDIAGLTLWTLHWHDLNHINAFY
jgi:hypothetical protein